MRDAHSSQKSTLLWFGFIGSAALFVLLSFLHIRQAVTPDELWWLVAAKTFFSVGKPLYFNSSEYIQAFSPHLYLLSIWAAFNGLGVSEVAARLPGVIAGVLSILLIGISVVSFSSGNPIYRQRLAVFICFLFALSPIAVQGAVIIDIDNTVLVPSLLFLCLVFFKYLQTKETLWAVLTTLAFMIALWTKLTTTTLMLCLFIMFILLQKGNLKYKWIALCALLAGIIAFVVSWYLYCVWKQIPFGQPFGYLLSSFISKSSGLRGMQIIQNIVYFTLWSGVFFMFLLVILLKRSANHIREKLEFRPEYGYLMGALVIIAGYSVVGGTTFGFPKYQSPALALSYIATALLLLNDKSNGGLSIKAAFIIFMAAFIIQFFIVGDLIYTARYTLRKAAVFSPEMYGWELSDFIIRLCLPAILYAGFAVYMYRSRKGSHLLVTTLLLMLGANTSLTLLQIKAPYQTGYSYGAEGTKETADYLLRTVPREGTIIAPSEIIYYVKSQPSSYQFGPFWESSPAIIDQLSAQDTSCFVYSIASNTVNQVRLISRTNGAIMGILHQSYCHFKIGSYEIWISNKHVSCT